MARSKKIITKAQFKTVKATAVSNQPVGYTGQVSVKLQKGGYTVKTLNTHNSATMQMLHGISQFLAGAFNPLDHKLMLDMTNYIPQYLSVGYQAVPTATNTMQPYKLFNEYNINRVKLEKGNPYPEASGKGYIVPFSASIDYVAIGSRRISEIGLFATEKGNTLLARVNVSSDSATESGIELAIGMNLLVEWNIIIQNTYA